MLFWCIYHIANNAISSCCSHIQKETTLFPHKQTLRRLAAQREAHLFLTVDKEDQDNYRSAVKADLRESKPLTTPRKLSYASSPTPASTVRSSVAQNRYQKHNYRAPPTSTKKHAPSAPLETHSVKAAPMVITSTPVFKHTPRISRNDHDVEPSSDVGEPNQYKAPTTSIAGVSQTVPNYHASATNLSLPSDHPPQVYQRTQRDNNDARFEPGSNVRQPTQQSSASQNNIQTNPYRATLQHQNTHSVTNSTAGVAMPSMAQARPLAYQRVAASNTAGGDGGESSKQYSLTQHSSEPNSHRTTLANEIAQPIPNSNTAATVTSLPIAYPPGYQRTPRARTVDNGGNSSGGGVHSATSRLEPRIAAQLPDNRNNDPAFVSTIHQQNSLAGDEANRQRFLPATAIPPTIRRNDNDAEAIRSATTANVSAGERYEHPNIARGNVESLSPSPSGHRLRNKPRNGRLSTHGVNGSGLSKVQQEMLPDELSDWSTGQAIRWLDSLGRIYQQYEQTFSDNEVDGAMLTLIAKCGVGDARGLEVLEALGVTNRAHQWKIQTHLDAMMHKSDAVPSPTVDKQDIGEQPHPRRQRDSGRQTQVRQTSAADLEVSDIGGEGAGAGGMDEVDAEPTHICRLHKEKCHWYCLKCNELACNFCEMYGPHKQSDGHHCVLACDAYPEQRERLASDRRFLNVYQGDALAHVALLERHHTTLEANLKSQEAAIRGFCDQARAAIKTREQHLLAKLREMSGRETRRTENELSTMQRHAENCRVALDMSNTALGPQEPRNVFTGKTKAPASHSAGSTNNKASGDVMQLLMARKPVTETVQTLRFSVLPKPPYALEQEQLVRFKQGLALKRLTQVVSMSGSVVGPSPDQVELLSPSKIVKPSSQLEQKESLTASTPHGKDPSPEDTNAASMPPLAFSPRKQMTRTAASSRSRHTRRSPPSRHQQTVAVKSQQQQQQKQHKKTPEEPAQMQPSTSVRELKQRQSEQVQRQRRLSQEKEQYRKHQRLSQSGSMFRTSSPNKREDALEPKQQRRRQNLLMRERVLTQEEQLKKQNRQLRMKQEENEQLKEQLQQQQQHTIRALEKSSTPMVSTGYRSSARTSSIVATPGLLHAPVVKSSPSRAERSPRRRRRVDGGTRKSSRDGGMGATTMQESITIKSLATQIRSPAKQVMAVDAANIPSSLDSPSQQQLGSIHTPTRAYSPTRGDSTDALTSDHLMTTPTRGHSSPKLHAQLKRLRTELAQQQQHSLVESQRQEHDLLSSEMQQQHQQQQHQQRRQHLEEELELQQRQQKRRHKKIELKQRQQDREDEEDRKRQHEERLQQSQIKKLRRKEKGELLRQQLNHQELRLHHHEMQLRESKQQKQQHHRHYLSHHEQERKRLQMQEEQLLLQQRKQKLHRQEKQQQEERKQLDHTLTQQQQKLQHHELQRQERTQRHQQYEDDQRLRLEEQKQREEQQTRTQRKLVAQQRQQQRQQQQQLEEERENQQERQRQRQLQLQRSQQEQDFKMQWELRQDLQQQHRGRDDQRRERLHQVNAQVHRENSPRYTLPSTPPAGKITTSTYNDDDEGIEHSRLDISYLSRTGGASSDEDMPGDVNLDDCDSAAGTEVTGSGVERDAPGANDNLVSSRPSRRFRSARHHVPTGVRSNAPLAQSPYLKYSRGAILKPASVPPATGVTKRADWSRAQTSSAIDMSSHRPAHALPMLSSAASHTHPRHRSANPHVGPAVNAPSLGDMEEDIDEGIWHHDAATHSQARQVDNVAEAKKVVNQINDALLATLRKSAANENPAEDVVFVTDDEGEEANETVGGSKKDSVLPASQSTEEEDQEVLENVNALRDDDGGEGNTEVKHNENSVDAESGYEEVSDGVGEGGSSTKLTIRERRRMKLLADFKRKAANIRAADASREEKLEPEVGGADFHDDQEWHDARDAEANAERPASVPLPASQPTEADDQEIQDSVGAHGGDGGEENAEVQHNENSVDAESGYEEALDGVGEGGSSQHGEYARDEEDATERKQANKVEERQTGADMEYADMDENADYPKPEEAMGDEDDGGDLEQKMHEAARPGDREVGDYQDADYRIEFEGDVAGDGVDEGMHEADDHDGGAGVDPEEREDRNEFDDDGSAEQNEDAQEDGDDFIDRVSADYTHGGDDGDVEDGDDGEVGPQLSARDHLDYSAEHSNEAVNEEAIEPPQNEDQTLATTIIDQVLNDDDDDDDDDLDQSDDSDQSVY